jgi:peptidyl-prolyl cis-trans isomerase A (cyclophilin A)
MKRSALIVLAVFAAACEKAPAPAAEKPAAPAPAVAAAPAAPAEEAAAAPISTAGLLHPDAAKLAAAGPDSFVVHIVSSRGPIDLKVHRAWSPRGADRLYYLVSNGFYDNARFFRVINGFMAQIGFAGDPAITAAWESRSIKDDAVKHSNTRGTVTFAKTGAPDSRGTQLFFNFGNNANLDGGGFAPIGEVTNGMNAVDSLYSGYGDGGDMGGKGPMQGKIAAEGNAYLNRDFPKLDFIKSARVSQEWKKGK